MLELKVVTVLRVFALFEEQLKLFPLFIFGHVILSIQDKHTHLYRKELGSCL